jgi:ABC-type phosphate transport system substrate-binding protein
MQTPKQLRRRKIFATFMVADVALGVLFGGLAVSSAYGLEGDGVSVESTPAPVKSTSEPVEPSAEPTPTPEKKVAKQLRTTNADGSVDIDWIDGLSTGPRDTLDPNYLLFQDLTFNVSQTTNLSYQVIDVTWENAQASPQGSFSRNFMQIMQCWDDGSGVAKPENCQWGTPNAALGNVTGLNTAGRTLIEGEDVLQSYGEFYRVPPPRTNPNLRQFSIPFVTVKDQKTFTPLDFFDSTLSNEITGAPTSADGSGIQGFEVQTSLEAPHLGCGAVKNDGSIQSCWLVIVPRGEYNVAGQFYADSAGARLSSSPLSASNWADRVEVPLVFKSVVSGCNIGVSEQRTVGNENVGPAFSSWQAFLCRDSATFGFSQIGDGEARRQVMSDVESAARLGFVSNPIDATTAGTTKLKYAPVAQSATVVAFNIDYLLGSNSDIFDKLGSPVTDLTLNARLIAKMLTQSYRNDVPNGDNQPHVRSNPRSLRHDEEFLRLNPEFRDFVLYVEPDGLLLPLGNKDAYAAIWQWIKADPDAAAFLGGAADPYGMVVNPNYRALGILTDSSIDSFPKADPSTFKEYNYIPDPGYGSFELRPYVLDMAEAAVKVSRADPGSKIFWEEFRNPPAFVSQGAQALGRQFILGVTDYASALRLGLSVAKLKNAGGHSVLPTTESIAAGIGEFGDSEVTGVSVFNPSVTGSNSYPLSSVNYAVVNVCAASISALKDYSTLLSYIADEGQVIGNAYGELPPGYVPLSEADAKVTSDVAAALKAEAKTPTCPRESTTDSTDDIPLIPGIGDTGGTGVDVETPSVGAPTGTFPLDPNAASKYALLSAMFLGVPFIFGGRTLIRRGMDIPD